MQNKRDQLQAHLFVMSRLASAVLRAEPDAPSTPMRRTTIATFAGAMLAAAILGVSAIIGLVAPTGGTAWKTQGTIIVVEETGSRFVYAGGVLRPVLNQVSAKLLTGAQGHVDQVPEAALAGTPHGSPVGIPGAPDALPNVAQLTGSKWLACVPTVIDPSGTAHQEVVALLGGAAANTTASDNAIVARTPDGASYVVWHGKRFLASPARLTALGYDGVQSFAVPPQWLNALSAGEDLQPIAVPELGTPGRPLGTGATSVGQVFVTNITGSSGYFVLERDGLLPVTATQAALLLGAPETAAAYPGRQAAALELSPAEAASTPRSTATAAIGSFAATPPKAVSSSADHTQTPCAALAFDAVHEPTVSLTFLDTGAAGPVTGDPATNADTADRVVVAPGEGVLARELPAPGITDGALYLITDLGVKYPLPSPEVAGVLGYGAARPVLIPGPMLSLLPTGPVLDPQAAGAQQPAIPVTSSPTAGTG